MNMIDQALTQKLGSSQDNLAIYARVMTDADQIEGNFTVEVEKADQDFEKKLRHGDTSMVNRLNLGYDFIKGLDALHSIGYAYGDMKPENCLIFGEKLKIADFGKTEQIREKSLPYKGNTRFAPPEGVQSLKGDVYSGALVLIRNFEEKYLIANTKDSLNPIQSEDRKMNAKENLRGIEKFVVESKDCPTAGNPGTSLQGLKCRYKMGNLSQPEITKQETAIHEYITRLGTELVKDLGQDRADGLIRLLKDMTLADPQRRLSMADVKSKWETIFAPKSAAAESS